MAKEKDLIQSGILGDINPVPAAKDHMSGSTGIDSSENDESTESATRHDSTGGGLGTKVGGTRNYRQGSGATGADLGNRPE